MLGHVEVISFYSQAKGTNKISIYVQGRERMLKICLNHPCINHTSNKATNGISSTCISISKPKWSKFCSCLCTDIIRFGFKGSIFELSLFFCDVWHCRIPIHQRRAVGDTLIMLEREHPCSLSYFLANKRAHKFSDIPILRSPVPLLNHNIQNQKKRDFSPCKCFSFLSYASKCNSTNNACSLFIYLFSLFFSSLS